MKLRQRNFWRGLSH